jgi:hypothetical protein
MLINTHAVRLILPPFPLQRTQGLLRRYRVQMKRLRDELAAAGDGIFLKDV